MRYRAFVMGHLKIGVMGAGAIGLYLGGKLAATGADVVFVGRSRLKAELEAGGLILSDLYGARDVLAKERIQFATATSALADCDVVLFCVKSGQTTETAQELAAILRRGAVVVSMQNGLHNAEALRLHLPEMRVLGGIVSFNVVWQGNGELRRSTSGPLIIEAATDPRVVELAQKLTACGFIVELPVDIRPLQWTKLILNLSNAVGALTDQPTRDLVFKKEYRRTLAAIMSEAIRVLGSAGIHPARLGTPIPVRLFPYMLRLPTPLFRLVARAQIKIDPKARSSMWEDLSKGRLTEVEELNGEIVRLAKSCGSDAPINRHIVDLIHQAERQGKGSPKLSADALWTELHGSR